MMNPTQTTDTLLMVRPANFGFNDQTAQSNAFQQNDTSLSPAEISRRAVQEFDSFVQKLRNAGVQVIVADDTPNPVKPDAIFPNNWVSFHENGTIITYPMYAPSRRIERSESIINQVLGYRTATHRIDFANYEAQNVFLEGTGSLIFDRVQGIAYACLSPRTHATLFDEFCAATGYQKVQFTATDANGQLIYHTNVMMAMGNSFVVICMESIADLAERQHLYDLFAQTNKEVIELSFDQMNHFAGNMLQVQNTTGKTFLVMSSQAHEALTPLQIQTIERHTNILHSPLTTIETYGGGSARCMMAEVFLPAK